MKKDKILTASVMVATASAVLLPLFAMYAFYGLSFLQETDSVLYLIFGICAIATAVFAILNIIMHSVAAAKSKKDGKIGKGLVVTNMIFEFLQLAVVAVAGYFFATALGVFSSAEAIFLYACPMILPAFVLVLLTLIAFILNIVGISGAKKSK